MVSSRTAGSKILAVISVGDAERLLLDWANLGGPPHKALAWLNGRHGDVFKPLRWDEGPERLNAWEIWSLRGHLRKAWDAQDRRIREWHIFQLRRKFAEWSFALSPEAENLAGKPYDWFEQAPPVTALEATMLHFQAIGDRARHCQSSNCPAPYFIAVKRWQKFCSPECAGPGVRESKLRWWNKHKNEENEKRRKS